MGCVDDFLWCPAEFAEYGEFEDDEFRTGTPADDTHMAGSAIRRFDRQKYVRILAAYHFPFNAHLLWSLWTLQAFSHSYPIFHLMPTSFGPCTHLRDITTTFSHNPIFHLMPTSSAPCSTRESITSPVELKRRKSRTELIRQLSKQKSIVSNLVDEEMPEQKRDVLIREENIETGVVSWAAYGLVSGNGARVD